MNQFRHIALTILAATASAPPAWADAPAPPQAVGPAATPAITPYADIRFRLELVDQAGLPHDAAASTLRLRAGIRTATWRGLSALIEGEAIARIGAERYNDTVNGRTAWPVVADPADVLLNQALIRYRPSAAVEATVGRQAVNLDNQRWIGSVNWRQNDQTLDAARITLRPAKPLSIDYLHAWRVNRVFGPDSPQGIWRGTAIHAARAGYGISNVGALSVYGYWLDIPSAPASSSRTMGVRIAGERPVGGQLKLLYAAEYARQHNFAGNPQHFGLDYLLVEPGLRAGSVTLRGGYERLEGNGTAALQTPLATLHAFNGWADKFLTTPANGLGDLYLDAGWNVATKGPLKGLALRGMWHDYRSTRASLHYGREWDLLASLPVTRQITLSAKLARYDARSFASDTTKAWFSLEARF